MVFTRTHRTSDGPLTLKEAQALVGGGLVEKVTLGVYGTREVDLLCNEEGLLKAMLPSLGLLRENGALWSVLRGPVAVVGAEGGEWWDLELIEAALAQEMMSADSLMVPGTGRIPLMTPAAWLSDKGA